MTENMNQINEIEHSEPAVLTENIAKDAEAISDAASGSVEKYIELFSTQAGYTELGIIAAAAAMAWLAAKIIDWIAHKRFPSLFNEHWSWLMRPLKLLPSLLTILALVLASPVIAAQVEQPHFVGIAIQIATAWLLIKTTFMLVSSKLIAWLLSSVIVMVVTLEAFDLLAPTKQLLSGIGFEIGDGEVTLLGILNGALLCVVLIWLALAGSRRIETQLYRTNLSYNIRELLIKFSKVLLFSIALLASLSVMGVDLTALAVFGGALGVGIGFGLQTITSNFISGIILLLDKSIKQGDLIEVNGVEGYVRRLNIRSTTIETFSGQEVTVPNETLISNNLTNFTMNNRKARIEIPIGVAYGSDYGRAKELLLQAAKSHPRCMEDPKPGCFMREFADSSVNFRLQFWVEDVIEGRLGPQSEVMFEIARLFNENHIEIPFPQRDVNLKHTAE